MNGTGSCTAAAGHVIIKKHSQHLQREEKQGVAGKIRAALTSLNWEAWSECCE